MTWKRILIGWKTFWFVIRERERERRCMWRLIETRAAWLICPVSRPSRGFGGCSRECLRDSNLSYSEYDYSIKDKWSITETITLLLHASVRVHQRIVASTTTVIGVVLVALVAEFDAVSRVGVKQSHDLLSWSSSVSCGASCINFSSNKVIVKLLYGILCTRDSKIPIVQSCVHSTMGQQILITPKRVSVWFCNVSSQRLAYNK